MSINQQIESTLENPQLLETLYRRTRQDRRTDEFRGEIEARYAAAPDNLLLAAWHFRLQAEAAVESAARALPWRLAIPFSLALSLIVWLATPPLNSATPHVPVVLLIWAPATALMVILFLAATALRARPSGERLKALQQLDTRNPALLAVVLAALAIFGYVVGTSSTTTIGILLFLHLPVLSTLVVAWYLAGPGTPDADRHALVLKVGEIVLTGGIILAAALAFSGVTMGLFSAIGITLPDPVVRWLIFGVAGLIPVMTVALTYDVFLSPREQHLDQGLPRLLFTVARVFLPLAVLVGIIYLASIPANFSKPFEQREVLIIYNAMLFGVMALLAFATPLSLNEIPARWQVPLRRAMLVLAAMTIVVSIYALSATVYRTALGGLTVNRLMVIGWNLLNLGVLILFLAGELRFGFRS